MPTKAVKRVLKAGVSSVFFGGATVRRPVTWRLDVREDKQGRETFSRKGNSVWPARGRPKLFHYISAGGMRQLRRTSADDLAESRRQAFLFFLGFMVFFWVLFYLLPCG